MQLYAQSRINSLRFEHIDYFSEPNYRSWSGLTTGMIWSENQIQAVNQKIITELHNRGFLFARIDCVSVSQKQPGQDVNLTWYIHEDLPFEVGRIELISDSISSEDLLQQTELAEGVRYNEAFVAMEFQQMNRYLANRGFPFSEINISDFRIRKTNERYSLDIDLEAQTGKRIFFHDIIIRGNTVTKSDVIIRETDIERGAIFRQNLLDDIPDKLYRLGFFKEVGSPKLRILPNGKSAVMIDVVEGNTTTFDGVVGYIPPDQNRNEKAGYFTGLISLNLRNLFGTGRKLEVDWKKPDQLSDEFRIFYEEPWVFGYPVNIGGGLERLVRDSTYIENQMFLNGTLRLSSEWKGSFRFMSKSVVPDSLASRDLRLARTGYISGEIGIDYDTRDNMLNPRSGIHYTTFFSFGVKENRGPDYLLNEDQIPKSENIQAVRGELAVYNELFRNQVLAFVLTGGDIRGSKNRLQLSDHYWFGGSRSVRGYRENQFHGTTTAWLNVEYRFITGRDSRIFIFNDWGFFRYKENQIQKDDIFPGYGIGIRFGSPLGIMSVDYGLGRGDSFSTGKIHFGVVNRF